MTFVYVELFSERLTFEFHLWRMVSTGIFCFSINSLKSNWIHFGCFWRFAIKWLRYPINGTNGFDFDTASSCVLRFCMVVVAVDLEEENERLRDVFGF